MSSDQLPTTASDHLLYSSAFGDVRTTCEACFYDERSRVAPFQISATLSPSNRAATAGAIWTPASSHMVGSQSKPMGKAPGLYG